MPPLTDADRRALLKLSREALLFAIEHTRPMRVIRSVGALAEPGGAFVTLMDKKRLRGCIGRLDWSEPLASVVAACAYSAAMEDPRFAPVTAAEAPALNIELSILSPPRAIAPEQVKVGEHGLIISSGHQRGVLLPQVATEYHWDAVRFLEETCRKSGLPLDAWRDQKTLIEAFTADVFSERDFAEPAFS